MTFGDAMSGYGGPRPPDVGSGRTPWYRKPTVWIWIGIALVVSALVFLLIPRPKFVASEFEVPESIVGGEDVEVSVMVANEGGVHGEREVTLLVDEEPVQTVTVALEAGAEELVSISLPDLSPGTYDIGLAGWDELGGVVWVMRPPEFVIDSLRVSPNPMNINVVQTATVYVTVLNSGEAAGSYDLQLMLDNEVVEERSIELEGGADTDETFTLTVDEPGSTDVKVGDVSVDWTVHQLEQPASGTVVVKRNGEGNNRITISNDTGTDVMLALSTSTGSAQGGNVAAVGIYVRAHSTATVSGIQDGLFFAYFTFGSKWCTHFKEFTDDALYGVFLEPVFLFSGDILYTQYTVEFEREGVGFMTEAVAEGDFPLL